MFKNWRNLSWKGVRPLLVRGLQFSLRGVAGPLGAVASFLIPIVVDKLAKPAWQYMTRKTAKAGRVIKGKKKAKETRDASTDNVDDIFNSMQ